MSVKSYILGQVVARGGMAEVYRGLQVGQDGFRRLVAIKRILPHHAQNAEYTEMFKDEAHIGQRLQHANIVKVEGFDIIDGSASIVMEFVDGSDLRALLAATENKKAPSGIKNFVPAGLCAYITAEAARGLHYAHTRRDDVSGKPLNIVHRDMSPQNLLISWEGEVKVTDFGIAAADRDFKQTETKAGIVKGKYSYMSPEQISGKKCDSRTDVFALCVVLWEMLAMRRLFISDNEIDVIEMVRHCKIPSRLRELNPSVTEELEMIVLRGLAKDPRKRYESMDALEKVLRAYLTKSKSTASASDLAAFAKDILKERREASQEEMRKILTSANQPAASQKQTPHQSLELALDTTPANGRSHLVVGRSRLGAPGQQTPDGTVSQTPHVSQRFSRGPAHNQTSGPRRASGFSQLHRQPNQATNTLTWFAALLTLTVIGGALFKKHSNAAKQALALTIRSTPQPVRIKINDRDAAGGRFLASPAKIHLDPGLNSVEVSRPGYKTEKQLINTEEGMPKTPPSFRLKPSAQFAPVRVEYRGQEPATISINEGFIRQAVTPQQPIFQIPDMTSGVPADLIVINSERTILFRCGFTPANSTEKRPVIVIVDAKSGKCVVSGTSAKGDR